MLSPETESSGIRREEEANATRTLIFYSYAIVRVVPRVERGEFVNVGVVLFSREIDYLGARLELEESRLLCLAPDVDIAQIERHLESFQAICEGSVAGGPVAELPKPERFHWLVSPRSTSIQTSPVHVGRSEDPRRDLEDLLNEFVRPPRNATGVPALEREPDARLQ